MNGVDVRAERAARAKASAGVSAANAVARRAIEREAPSGDTCIDVGAGTGVLVEWLAARYRRVVAVDIVAYEGRTAGEWLSHDLNEPLPIDDHTVDLVVGVGILEALENPRAALRDWSRVLRPGGRLIGTVPNIESWRSVGALVTRHSFPGLREGAMGLHAFTRVDLARHLEASGFADASISPSGQGLIPAGSRTWQSLPFFNRSGLRWSDDLVWVART